ncbi:biotin transporter BioY [Terriglobus tenax]|uniref:biotin transporter BioY n=1 Tax=Terriglobus tenax TaxID=1111115 RepID=UPI0021E0A17B|nr:biotin transporter BioY [Terriglobus tenax]
MELRVRLSSFVFAENTSLTRNVAKVALGTLFLAASSWMAVPMFPVPITMQTYAVLVVGALFGARMGVITVLAWLAEALIGLPVLAHGSAGAAVFLGPTAGYIASFPVTAAFIGWLADRKALNGVAANFGAMLAGNAINLAMGAAVLAGFVGGSKAIAIGVVPFLIGAVVKAVLATGTCFAAKRSFKPAN